MSRPEGSPGDGPAPDDVAHDEGAGGLVVQCLAFAVPQRPQVVQDAQDDREGEADLGDVAQPDLARRRRIAPDDEELSRGLAERRARRLSVAITYVSQTTTAAKAATPASPLPRRL
jgi:hypothetical protein